MCNGSYLYKEDTVNSTYNGSAYKKLSVIRNWFSFHDLNPSLFYVKIYGYSGFGYKKLSLIRNSFFGPNAYESILIVFALSEPTFGQVRTSPLDYPIIDEYSVDVVTDRLKIVYCLFNEIIGVSLLNVFIRAVQRRTVFKQAN